MRIKLPDSKKFFIEILNREKTNLRQFSNVNGINYSTFKKYWRGELALPQEIFDELIKYSPNKEYWLNSLIKLEDNWGLIKAGKVYVEKNDVKMRMAYARKFRKIKVLKPKGIKLNKSFCEFYGALLGDGCICRFKDSKGIEKYAISIVGNKLLDASYLNYLKDLIKKEWGIHSCYYEYKKINLCRIHITNKSLCLILNSSFKVPIGKKYETLAISKKINNLNWNIKKFVLRGLFDTDGCILANKRENYRYPWIVITSKSEYFRNQLIKMLREQNYPAYNTGKDVCVRGINNVKRWFNDIGSSNNRNILKYKYFLKHGYLPARLLIGPVV